MTASDTAHASPYERALGERISELHPKTAWYFRTIPDGQVGVGTGVFTTAGSHHRWLWPMFRIAESLGVAFAGWERDVPSASRTARSTAALWRSGTSSCQGAPG